MDYFFDGRFFFLSRYSIDRWTIDHKGQCFDWSGSDEFVGSV